MIEKINSQLTSAMRKIPAFVNKYRYFIGGAIVLVFFSVTILRIDSLSSPVINKDTYNAGLLEIEKVEFNTAAIERIDELDERNVNVTENIDDGRTNPF